MPKTKVYEPEFKNHRAIFRTFLYPLIIFTIIYMIQP